MAANISRNPLAFRARAMPASIVIDPKRPELGSVKVVLCEIPKGMRQELNDDETFFRQEISSLTEEIKVFDRSKRQEFLALRKKLGDARRELLNNQLSFIAWGVCGHDEKDFNDPEVNEPFKFHEGSSEYDGVKYRVASNVTVGAYASIGEPFLKGLHEAINLWQRSIIVPPDEVWKKEQERQERLQAIVEKSLKEQLGTKGDPYRDPFPTTETTKQETTSSETQTS